MKYTSDITKFPPRTMWASLSNKLLEYVVEKHV